MSPDNKLIDMKKQVFNWDRFNAIPIIGIIRGLTREEVAKVLPVYISAGFGTVEITMNTPGALEIIKWLSETYGEQVNTGAGTVCTTEDFHQAVNAGAQFIVSPILKVELIKTAVASGIPVFPGAFSPTEIYQAWEAGAAMVKVFPATLGSIEYIKQIKAPLNNIKLLPTGGVTPDNLPAFLKAGADGFGIGGEIFDKKLIMNNELGKLEEKMKGFVAVYNECVGG